MKSQKLKISLLCLILFTGKSVLSQTSNEINVLKNLNGIDSVFIFKTEPKPVAIVGDLQRTSIFGRILSKEQNDSEREKIIQSIDSLHPGLLIILGDMVFQGSDTNMWLNFDSLIYPIKHDSISTSVILGNHDYYFNAEKGLKNFSERFPRFRTSHWYTQIYDSLALIYLDSNLDYYTQKERQTQIDWYAQLLNGYDSSSAIKGILIFLHHPPYSNKIITADNPEIEKAFVPEFINSKKTLAMISGHVHTYERFKIGGKIFIVSGGGGGPRVEVTKGKGTHKDLYDGGKMRPFNYLIFQITKGGINVKVIGLDKDSSAFFTMEKFFLPYSN